MKFATKTRSPKQTPRQKPADSTTEPKTTVMVAPDNIVTVNGRAWAIKETAAAILAACRAILEHGPEKFYFGEAKVFIYGAWREGFGSQISLEDFKDLLRALQPTGRIALSRFDLVEARDSREGQEITRLSEVSQPSPFGGFAATYNFINVRESTG